MKNVRKQPVNMIVFLSLCLGCGCGLQMVTLWVFMKKLTEQQWVTEHTQIQLQRWLGGTERAMQPITVRAVAPDSSEENPGFSSWLDGGTKSTSTHGVQEENHHSQNCWIRLCQRMTKSLMNIASTFFGQIKPHSIWLDQIDAWMFGVDQVTTTTVNYNHSDLQGQKGLFWYWFI